MVCLGSTITLCFVIEDALTALKTEYAATETEKQEQETDQQKQLEDARIQIEEMKQDMNDKNDAMRKWNCYRNCGFCCTHWENLRELKASREFSVVGIFADIKDSFDDGWHCENF